MVTSEDIRAAHEKLEAAKEADNVEAIEAGEVKRKPCKYTDCEHYYSDGSYCIEVICYGKPGITVAEMEPLIAGGRTL